MFFFSRRGGSPYYFVRVRGLCEAARGDGGALVEARGNRQSGRASLPPGRL